MATIENFILKFKTEGEAGIKAVSGTIQNLGKDIEGLIPSGGALGNTLTGIVSKLGPVGLAAAAAAAVLSVLGGKALALADSLGDLSDATGIGASNLLDFKQSLIAAGAGTDTFEKFASKLSVSIGEAADGNNTYKESFRALGVNTVDVNGKLRSSEAILQETIAALGQIADPAERARLATSLLGKEAARVDWSKVSAGKNAITDEQIAALNKYNDAIDKFKNTLSTKFLTFFGSLAVEINAAFDASEKLYNSIKKSIQSTLGIKQPNFLPQSEVDNENRRLLGRAPAPTAPGAAGNINKEALEASTKRIADATSQTFLQAALRTRDEMNKIKAQADADIKGIQADIAANKQLSGPEGAGQRAAELAARTAAVRAKQQTQEYELQNRLNDAINQFSLQQQQLTDNYENGLGYKLQDLNASTKLIGLGEEQLAIEQAKYASLVGQRSLIISLSDELAKTKLQIGIDANAPAKVEALENSIARIQKITGLQIETVGKYAKANLDALRVEQQRVDSLNQLFARDNDNITQKTRLIDLTSTQNEQTINAIRLSGELAAQQRIQQEQLKLGRDGQVSAEEQTRIREEQQKTTDQLVKNTQEQIDKSREFGTGWAQAYKQYAEDANNASKQAQGYFATFTQGFEDAIVNFVKTGKLSFKDLANSIISDFVRIQAKQIALGLFGGGGTGSGIGNFFSMLAGVPGRAGGGPVAANTPYLVGENGPELFLSRSAGTIIPNNQLSASRGGGNTQVTYNISAVDATSFRQMLAREPEFLYAVTEKGRSSIPAGRR